MQKSGDVSDDVGTWTGSYKLKGNYRTADYHDLLGSHLAENI